VAPYLSIQQPSSYNSYCTCKFEVYTFQRTQFNVVKLVLFILLNSFTLKTHEAHKYCLYRLTNPHCQAVPWLRRLAAGLPPRRPGFDPGSVHVGFVVDKVALGQVFPRVLRFSPVNFIPVLHHRHPHHRVAQEASRLQCVLRVCCEALHHKNPHCHSYCCFISN
jgi:hypothetical protein